ncbi:methyl-accepting chemotaxis protein [Desulfobaculum sp.]
MLRRLGRRVALRYIGAVGIVLSVLGVVLGTIQYERQHNEEREMARANAHMALQGAATALESWIDGQKRLAQSLARRSEIVEACASPADSAKAARAHEVLQWVHDTYGIYENIPLAARLAPGERVSVTGPKGEVGITDGTFFVDTVQGRTLGKGGTQLSYNVALAQGAPFSISEVYPSLLRGNPIFVLAAPVREQGQLVGSLILALKMTAFTETFVRPVTFGETGHLFFSDSRGSVIAHPKAEAILSDAYSRKNSDALSRISSGDSGFEADIDGVSRIVNVRPVVLSGGNTQTDWFICSSQDKAELDATLADKRATFATELALLIVVMALVLYALTHGIVVRPLRRVTQYVRAVAGGDFRAEPGRLPMDEIGDVGRTVQEMTEGIIEQLQEEKGFMTAVLDGIANPFAVTDVNLSITACSRSMLRNVGRGGEPKDYIGMNLSQFLFNDTSKPTILTTVLKDEKPRTGVNFSYTSLDGRDGEFIIDVQPLYDVDGTLVGGITFWNDVTALRHEQAAVAEQNARIEAAAKDAAAASVVVGEAVSALTTATRDSMQRTDAQKARVTETVTAIEEMNATVLEVAQNAADAARSAETTREEAASGEAVVRESVESIVAVRESIAKLRGEMDRLGTRVDGIGSVMTVINDIADQTNLLALNAAIEAARAGDAGRGFAVVADEVRKLAEKTMAATREVGEAITAIQSEAHISVEAMGKADTEVSQSAELAQKTRSMLEGILALTGETSDKVRNIATAAEQQSAASEQIAHSATEIDEIAGETAQAMQQSSTDVASLSGEVERIRSIIGGMRQTV